MDGLVNRPRAGNLTRARQTHNARNQTTRGLTHSATHGKHRNFWLCRQHAEILGVPVNCRHIGIQTFGHIEWRRRVPSQQKHIGVATGIFLLICLQAEKRVCPAWRPPSWISDFRLHYVSTNQSMG